MRKPLQISLLFCLCIGFAHQNMSYAEQITSLIQLNNLSAWNGHQNGWDQVSATRKNPDTPNQLISVKETSLTHPFQNIMVNTLKKRAANIHSKAHHGDVMLHVEFMVPNGANSGVYLQGRYEIQILDSWGKEKVNFGDCGGIYERWKNGKGFEGTNPSLNASRAPGEWQTFDAIFRAPKFDSKGQKIANARFEKVIHNGILIHENVECTGPTRAASFGDEKPTGPLMLQGDHGPVAYKNIWILPLK